MNDFDLNSCFLVFFLLSATTFSCEDNIDPNPCRYGSWYLEAINGIAEVESSAINWECRTAVRITNDTINRNCIGKECFALSLFCLSDSCEILELGIYDIQPVTGKQSIFPNEHPIQENSRTNSVYFLWSLDPFLDELDQNSIWYTNTSDTTNNFVFIERITQDSIFGSFRFELERDTSYPFASYPQTAGVFDTLMVEGIAFKSSLF